MGGRGDLDMCAARRGKAEPAVLAVNGAILVARKLVSMAFAGGREEKVPVIAERARYCQLVAAKMRMNALDASKTILASWLSAVEDKPGLIETIVTQQGMEDIVFPKEGADRPPAADVVSLVRCYEDLSQQVSEARTDLGVTQKYLLKVWADTPGRQSMVRKFVNVLEDEKFLVEIGGNVAGRVLVVDPSEAVTPVLSLPLGNEGYEIEVVADVPAGKSAVAERRPDLVMCEVDIPIMNGIEFCKWIKGNPETADICVVMMAAGGGNKVGTRCLREGADDFLKKPVDLEMLFLKLERLAVKEKAVAAHTGESAVSGSLGEMEFTDMIQIFCAGNKNMRVDFSRDDQDGVICIRGGDIIHSRVGDRVGDDAFYELMGWKDGTFSARQWDEFPERTVETSTMSLLMEGARKVDEAKAKKQP